VHYIKIIELLSSVLYHLNIRTLDNEEGTMDSEISILIAARHDKDRSQILAILSEQDGISIIGAEKDEASLIIKLENSLPSIIIIDIQSIEIAIPDLVKMIRRRSASAAIIIISDNDDEIYASSVVKAGVSGYLLKDMDLNKLLHIVKIISLGGCYVNSLVNFKVYNQTIFNHQFPGQSVKPDITIYSPLEHSIITLMAQGHSDAEIAEKLNCSEGTIKNSLMAVRRKTKLNNRIEVAVFSLVFGFICIDAFTAWKEKIENILQNKTITAKK
jgi:DNA-binding NarL/FixJ family response regulator